MKYKYIIMDKQGKNFIGKQSYKVLTKTVQDLHKARVFTSIGHIKLWAKQRDISIEKFNQKYIVGIYKLELSSVVSL